MMFRARHLRDDRLFECYLAERDGEPMDLPAAEHLAGCKPCGARYADISTFMETLRVDGEADADAVFTPERLKAQQQQIARRLELVGHPAHVLSFPDTSARRAAARSMPRRAPGWAATAAAAGLLVGVALSASYEWGSRTPVARQQLVEESADARQARISAAPGRIESLSDEVFLSELELALERPHTPELMAFDALTPYVLEVSAK